MRSKEIEEGFIITEHYKGEVVNFYWFETLIEAEKFGKALEPNQSTYIISEVLWHSLLPQHNSIRVATNSTKTRRN